jgi:hypothetical protein
VGKGGEEGRGEADEPVPPVSEIMKKKIGEVG